MATTTDALSKHSKESLGAPSFSAWMATREDRSCLIGFDFTFLTLELWYTREEAANIGSHGHSANSITRSEAFYVEIDQHPLPVERPVVAALANAPGAFDLYVWLAWKSWTLKGRP
jgi:hypothetical protein